MPGSAAEANSVKRGDVHLLDLSSAGGRLKETRPVLVVQNDVGNTYARETIVVPLRDRHGGRMLPIFVPVAKGISGLAKDFIVDAGHINTVAKEQLGPRLGSLPASLMRAVDQALRIGLALI